MKGEQYYRKLVEKHGLTESQMESFLYMLGFETKKENKKVRKRKNKFWKW